MKTILKLMVFGLCLLPILAGCSKKGDPVLYSEIKSVDKMVFATMSVTKMATMESSDWYTIGKRIAAYSYDCYLRAYIDLSTLQMDDLAFDDNTMTVKVTLPPVITEVTGRDMEMKKEYENIGLLRSELDSKERAEIKEIANKSFMEEVDTPKFQEPLIESAQKKARKYFETLFAAYGYTASIDFKSNSK